MHDQQSQRRRVDPNSQRRCTVMFDLSVDLARILEMLTLQLPRAFLRGSSLNLTRLVEVRCAPSRKPGPACSDAALLRSPWARCRRCPCGATRREAC